MKYMTILMVILFVSCADVMNFIDEYGTVEEESSINYEYNMPHGVYDLKSAFLFVSSMRYVSDTDAHGQREFWQAPRETIARGTGDCEDFAILFSSLADKMGYSTAIQLGNGHAISLINGVQYDPSPIWTSYGFIPAKFAPDRTEYDVEHVFYINKAIERALRLYDTY